MTFEIIFILILLIGCLIAFIREWASPDVIALTAFGLLMLFQILDVKEALSVFSNPAPLTIAAMFIMSAALQKTGALDFIGSWLSRFKNSHISVMLLLLMLVVGVASAFVNNTPIVAIFIPILLSVARTHQQAPSKLLMPLSFAAIMGGSCTLIGTSTNLIISGIVVQEQYNMQPIGLFEITPLAMPLLLIGIAYVALFGPKFLPDRLNITSVLSPEERKTFLCHTLVQHNSPFIGHKLTDTVLASSATFRIIEIRRNGARLTIPLNEITIRPFDRILFSAPLKYTTENKETGEQTLSSEFEEEHGLQTLSTVEGAIIEGIIAANSSLIAKTIRNIRFRQTFGMVILAVHREGRNLDKDFLDKKLEFGDTILMLGPNTTFDQLRDKGDFMLLEDREQKPEALHKAKAPFAWLAFAGIIIAASIGFIPIVIAAILGCIFLFLTKTIESDEAYRSIDWSIILLIYGMLGLGLGMEKTHTASYLAEHMITLIKTLVPAVMLPFIAIGLIYLATNILTELVSNSATAVVMTPIAINLALGLDLDPRPFVIAIMIAASASFLTPIGYQTNTMIYGAGGYKFTDFTRFGMPLALIFWLLSTAVIPLIWPLQSAS
ncbi:MAG: SLC13 family permease [Verrucomicrobiota bacterium]